MQTTILSAAKKSAKANTILATLKATGNFPAAKAWIGGEKVRIYTGHRNEWIEILENGEIGQSQPRLRCQSDIWAAC